MNVRIAILSLAALTCLSLVIWLDLGNSSTPVAVHGNTEATAGEATAGGATVAEPSTLESTTSSGVERNRTIEPSVSVAKRGLTVEVTIKGVKPDSGAVQIAVFNDATGFPDHEHAVEKLEVAASSDVVVATIQLQSPLFALAAYQDADENGELTKSAFGIPEEHYGFSNHARGQFGPPEYSEAMVNVRQGDLEIQLKP